jgi:phosphoenolpyruvate carboxykinase (GTP)
VAPQSLNTEGLDLSDEQLTTLLSVDHDEISRDLDDAEVFLRGLGGRLPGEILAQLQATRERLKSASLD